VYDTTIRYITIHKYDMCPLYTIHWLHPIDLPHCVCYTSVSFLMFMRISLVGLIATRKKVGVMVTVVIVCLTTGQLRMSTDNILLFIRDRCKLSLRARSMKFP